MSETNFFAETIERETTSAVYNLGLVTDQIERASYEFNSFMELYALFWQLPPTK
jgi:hypothetical protein